ncbi:8549_t:CDS:2 [Gigaspora margarita]|uniref:8549_t:CDS:1 n=1 Tax=Gigaspora margarita TaxID=4874 RepID=A0ABN7UF43_GIGMA|nr:8549_t:CDS:2 [Gigaspora margarita]
MKKKIHQNGQPTMRSYEKKVLQTKNSSTCHQRKDYTGSKKTRHHQRRNLSEKMIPMIRFHKEKHYKTENVTVNERTAPVVKKHGTNKEKNLPEWVTPMTKSHEEKKSMILQKTNDSNDEITKKKHYKPENVSTQYKKKTSSRKKVRFPEKLHNKAINEKTAPAVKRYNTNKEENLPGWTTPMMRSHEKKKYYKN